jgi:DNA gyrase subunit B
MLRAFTGEVSMQRSDEREGTVAPAEASYTADQIQVLDGLEAVRKRPGMYIGDVRDGSGLTHMLFEVVGNAIDQHLARRARRVRVDLDDDWVTIEDDGPGIPVAVHPHHDRPVIEVVFTTLHAGATFDGHHPHVHVTRGLRGVGLAAVNALCARLEVESRRDGKRWRMAFERGAVVEPLASHGATSRSGTRIRYRPDPQIFTSGTTTNAIGVEARLRELAWLNPLLAIDWRGHELPGRGGPAAWVRALAGELVGDTVVSVHRTIEDAEVDLAFGWRATRSDAPLIHSFVSQACTRDGGTHVQGFWRGLVDGLAPLAGGASRRAIRELFGAGLVAVVNVGLYDPRFGGPTKDRLTSPIAARVTRRAVLDALHAAQQPGAARELDAFLRERLPPPA